MVERISLLFVVALVTGGCSEETTRVTSYPAAAEGDPDVVRLVTQNIGAFLLRGQRDVLVDTGLSEHAGKLANALEELPDLNVTLIVLTHGHPDHAGGASELVTHFDVPVLAHEGDADKLREGHGGELSDVTPVGTLLKLILSPEYPAVEPDLLAQEEIDLSRWGINAAFVPAPGHTDGSAIVVTEGGDAFVGDTFASGGDNEDLADNTAGMSPFSEDPEADRGHVQALVARGVERFFVAHGGPALRPAVEEWLAQ